MIKVSVIIPVYNVEKYIEKCLHSLLEQSLEDLELIIVNDGSKDSSEKIIKEWIEINKENTKKEIVYLEKENGGLSDARNYGMKYARGEYIAFLDSDDYVEPTMYEEMYKKGVDTKSDFVECDFFWEFPEKQKHDSYIPYNTKSQMMIWGRVVAWNKLIKRELIEKTKIEFPKGLQYEDIEFFYKLLPHIQAFSYVEKPFIHYIQRSNSIANTNNEKTVQIYEVLDNVIKYYKENNLYNEFEKEIEYNYARYLLCSSFKRMTKIADKKKKKELLEKNWEILNNRFPNWKKNELLRKYKTGKNLYMRTVNRFTYKIYWVIL